ncbi:MAG: hypothetical protein II224_01710, partial [Ruminococcus sp.]|nr:hypothetical protein [Ruminococcus sp.]
RISMIISGEPHTSRDVLQRQRKLLSPLLTRMINPSYATLDLNVPFVRKAIAGGLMVLSGVAAAAYFAVKLIDND